MRSMGVGTQHTSDCVQRHDPSPRRHADLKHLQAEQHKMYEGGVRLRRHAHCHSRDRTRSNGVRCGSWERKDSIGGAQHGKREIESRTPHA